jgi:hypothetical protein
MLIDRSGTLGIEHARDLQRTAAAYRLGRTGHMTHGLREFLARGYLGPADNYRSR